MVLANAPEGLRPAWLSRTFSGNCRVVYLFEQDVPLFSAELAKEFLSNLWYVGAVEDATIDLTETIL
jgi:hypothetical protein